MVKEVTPSNAITPSYFSNCFIDLGYLHHFRSASSAFKDFLLIRLIVVYLVGFIIKPFLTTATKDTYLSCFVAWSFARIDVVANTVKKLELEPELAVR